MPSISTAKHIVRFVSILAYLRAHPGTTLRALSKAFDTDVRSMRRTLTTMVGVGRGQRAYWESIVVDIPSDPDEVVHVDEDQGITKALSLSATEAATILAGLSVLAQTPVPEFAELARRAAAKISAAGAGQAEVSTAPTPSRVGYFGGLAQEALTSGTCVKIRYVDGADKISERIVEPWQLEHSYGHWKLDGWYLLANGQRTFRLDRVLDMEKTTRPVDASRPQRPQRPALLTVRLRVRTDLGWLTDTIPSKVLRRGEDFLDIEIVVKDVEWFTRLLLRLGSGVLEVDQKAFSLAAVERAQRALAHYR